MKNFINTNASQQFFDMFVIDALIGNTDRHNSNWGFLYHKKDNTIDFAPIYDNGSCLNPMLEDSELEKLDDIELKNIIYNVYSCLKINNKKIHYFEFIQSMENTECNKALIRVFPRIDISRIKEFILRIEGMSDIRKEFYKKVIEGRYRILADVYKKLEK